MTDVWPHPDSQANLHCHLVTALHRNVRELSQHCTAALLKFYENPHEICNFVCNQQHGQTPCRKSNNQMIIQLMWNTLKTTKLLWIHDQAEWLTSISTFTYQLTSYRSLPKGWLSNIPSLSSKPTTLPTDVKFHLLDPFPNLFDWPTSKLADWHINVHYLFKVVVSAIINF